MTNPFEMLVGIIRLSGSHPGELLFAIGLITFITSFMCKEDKENKEKYINKRNLFIGGIALCIIGAIVFFYLHKKN